VLSRLAGVTCYSLPLLCEYRRRNFAAYREHHSRSKGRDCEIESGAPAVGGHKHNREEISTKEHGTTDAHSISGKQEKNGSGTASALGENQGGKKGVVRQFENQ
jgi:hypothetical protein